MVPPGLNVRGFLDSPLWVDELPMLPTIMPLQNETQAIYGLINATARIPPACAAAYPGAEGWKCLYGQYRIPFMTTPYLMSASQFDKYQLPYNEGGNPPYLPGTPQLAFADGFQGLVRSVVLNMPTASQPGSAVYSSACFKHCTSTLGSFWGVVLAAFLVGVVRGITIYFVPAAGEASMYVLMFLVLMFRPRGLLGERIERFE